ncbi:caspase family protein [Cellulomonas sp. H30R-01]|uniref:caspase family protein n=1 Tax=Cellulomonas sp. H30R-01 TaxID=2704467 RepID=UPI00138DC930|nr:caspase family protein [Cellulomonas sp. H30R-01]QHT55668.1 caspase family protein [Cellulomonas sp. H30R-01]
MTGYSLHIGLNRVDPDAYGGWDGKLNGCVNDANAMLRLATATGFQPVQLLDAAATSQAVITQIGAYARTAVAGDLVLLTYSGHGGQVADIDGDEPDQQDETWVLFDRQVLDDELRRMYAQFAAGVRVLVISDSCHSGTVIRDVERDAVLQQEREHDLGLETGARGGPPAVLPPAAVARVMPRGVAEKDDKARRATYEFVQSLAGATTDEDVAASVLLISGCQDDQYSYDGPVNGEFTGTLLRVWDEGAFAGSYVDLHRKVLDQMPSRQQPNFYPMGTPDDAFLAQQPFAITPPAGATTAS